MNKEEINKVFNAFFDTIKKEICFEKEWQIKINEDFNVVKEYAKARLEEKAKLEEDIKFMDELYEKYVDILGEYQSLKFDNELEVSNFPLEKNCCKEIEENDKEENGEEKENSEENQENI